MKQSIAAAAGLIGLGLGGAAWGQCETRWEQIWEVDGLVEAVEQHEGVVFALVRDAQYMSLLYQRVNGEWSLVSQPYPHWVQSIKVLQRELYAVGSFDLDNNPLTPRVGVVRRTANGWEAVASPAEFAQDIDLLEGDLVILGFNEQASRGALFRRAGQQWSILGVGLCQVDSPIPFAMAVAGSRLATTTCVANTVARPAVYDGGVWTANGSGNQYSKVFASGTELFFAPEFPDWFEPPLSRLVGDQWERLGPPDITGRVSAARELDGALWVGGWLRNRQPPFTVNDRLAIWNGVTFVGVQPQPPGLGYVNAFGMIDGNPVVAMAEWGTVSTSRVYILTAACICDSLDFNNDGAIGDPTDVDAFFSVFSEGGCVPVGAACSDVDFNNDGSAFDPCDVDSFLLAFSGGACTACGE